jgi:malonate transporter and related proteins
MVLLGALIGRFTKWSPQWTAALNRFVFAVPLPVLLFRAVSQVGGQTQADKRLLIAFFGSCFIVFVLGYFTAKALLRKQGAEPTIIGIASVFSNNGLLGIPLVHILIGPKAMPAVAWIMTFNAVTLWTLATVVIESTKHSKANFAALRVTLVKVGSSPIVIGIACGALVASIGVPIPTRIGNWLDKVSFSAGPLALTALGLHIARHKVTEELPTALMICVYKLLIQPVVAWGLCVAVDLPRLETQVVVLMASLSVGVNVHLMAHRFGSLQTVVASSLVLSTLIGAFTTPLVLALVL